MQIWEKKQCLIHEQIVRLSWMFSVGYSEILICDSDLNVFDSWQLTVGEDYRQIKQKSHAKVYGIWLTNRMDHFYDILIVPWMFWNLKT